MRKVDELRNVTIKGGVVMRSMTNNIRRATQDMDIDFIRYSLSDESIDLFVERLNCLNGVTIRRVGKIEELSQQDYNGKRVHVHIIDKLGNQIESKIDLGVHKHMEIEQEEYCFDIINYIKPWLTLWMEFQSWLVVWTKGDDVLNVLFHILNLIF